MRIALAEVGGNSTAHVALEGKLYAQRPESGRNDQHRTSDDAFLCESHGRPAYFRYFARNATVSFQASAASSAR